MGRVRSVRRGYDPCDRYPTVTFRPLGRYKRRDCRSNSAIRASIEPYPMSTVAPTRITPPAAGSPDAVPVVSVVIPCLNESENIERCVAAALEAIAKMGVYGEVVVADNNSE